MKLTRLRNKRLQSQRNIVIKECHDVFLTFKWSFVGPSVVSGWPITTEILSCIDHSIKDEIMIVDLAFISAGNLFV